MLLILLKRIFIASKAHKYSFLYIFHNFANNNIDIKIVILIKYILIF